MKLNTKRTVLVGFAFLSICAFWQMDRKAKPTRTVRLVLSFILGFPPFSFSPEYRFPVYHTDKLHKSPEDTHHFSDRIRFR